MVKRTGAPRPVGSRFGPARVWGSSPPPSANLLASGAKRYPPIPMHLLQCGIASISIVQLQHFVYLDRTNNLRRITDMFATIDLWKRRRQTRKELNALSDRELQDIGISRYDIERIVGEVE